MKISRLRSGEWLALLGAIGLALLLGLDWYFLSTPDARLGQHESGIRAIGWFAALLLLVAIVLALALAWTTVRNRPAAVPVTLAVLATVFGFLAVVTIAVRLIFQPGLGVEAGNGDVEIEIAAWLALIAAALIAVGAWRSMADERTETEEARRQTERVLAARGEPRPAPPPTMENAP